MDYRTHYRRARDLADLADAQYEKAVRSYGERCEEALRRAEVLARMSHARAQLAWVAYMGADIDAAARLVEDAKQAPAYGVTPLTTALNRLDARRRPDQA